MRLSSYRTGYRDSIYRIIVRRLRQYGLAGSRFFSCTRSINVLDELINERNYLRHVFASLKCWYTIIYFQCQTHIFESISISFYNWSGSLATQYSASSNVTIRSMVFLFWGLSNWEDFFQSAEILFGQLPKLWICFYD